MPPKDFPSAHYDSWKTTDPTWESSDDRALCAYTWEQDCFNHVSGHYTISKTCNIPFEDHDDESLGHIFVMPEPEQRDY